jgi:hypothetical protein
MHRQKFGEYYFRTVVMEYLSAQQSRKTIVSLAVLLEPSHYNFIDIDTAWGELALNVNKFGVFEAFTQNDFVTSGTVYIYLIKI